MKKLYIVSKYPPSNNNRNNINLALKEHKYKQALCFD